MLESVPWSMVNATVSPARPGPGRKPVDEPAGRFGRSGHDRRPRLLDGQRTTGRGRRRDRARLTPITDRRPHTAPRSGRACRRAHLIDRPAARATTQRRGHPHLGREHGQRSIHRTHLLDHPPPAAQVHVHNVRPPPNRAWAPCCRLLAVSPRARAEVRRFPQSFAATRATRHDDAGPSSCIPGTARSPDRRCAAESPYGVVSCQVAW